MPRSLRQFPRVPAVVAVLGLLHAGPVPAAPRVPADNAVVLEHLPLKPADPVARELRELRNTLAANPQDADTAVKLARRYFLLAMSEGDPRFIGYGEAALRPWWTLPEAPRDVLFVRALLKQYKHEFAAAHADLARASAIDPADEDVWLWRAALHLVQANYDEARKDCAALRANLRNRGGELDVVSCEASVQGMTGEAATAYRRLREAVARAGTAGPLAKVWVHTRLAEFSMRLGDTARAETHFRTALALTTSNQFNDQYLLAAWADFLLDQKRYMEIIPLLEKWVRSDILLLRLALAEQALGLPAQKAHVEALVARFEAAALRSERLHLAEESRLHLSMLNDPAKALALARENWQSQREPRDARAVLEAAVVLRDPAAAADVLEWLRQSRHEDPALAALAAKLAAGKP